MSTSKKTTKSSAKKSSGKLKDLGAKSNPSGGRKGARVASPNQAAAALYRESHPNLIQY